MEISVKIEKKDGTVEIKNFPEKKRGNEMEKQKITLQIRVKDGKTYVCQNHGEWLVNDWDDLSEDMRLVLNVLCRMDEFDVEIDAKKE